MALVLCKHWINWNCRFQIKFKKINRICRTDCWPSYNASAHML